MTRRTCSLALKVLHILPLIVVASSPVAAENVDPEEDGSQYAWAENVGWINAEPSGDGGPGVEVSDEQLSGWMWGENIGWISLSCVNTGSCDTVDYRVLNNGCGNLAGYAWGENVGWLSFSTSTSSVTIDPATGEFGGSAWGENMGWVTFADDSPVAYGVVTGWRRNAPVDAPEIEVAGDGQDLTLSWSAVPDADGYDVMQGSLSALLASGGDFGTSTTDCRADDQAATDHQQALSVGTDADFFLVRAVNCGGNGSCNSGGLAQANDRDPGITSSGVCQ